MADVVITRGSTLPDSSSKTDFHNLVDNATASVSNIVNADIASAAAIADTKLAQITTASKVHGSSLTGTLVTSKGADIPSATTTDIGAATGNFVDVTGTTTITGLGTIAAGAQRIVRFTGALTLTHNATSLILPTGANITTANGDVAGFVSLGSGNWKCSLYQKADGTALSGATVSTIYDGAVVQIVNSQTTTAATGSNIFPTDGSIPQITEGTEFITLAITPKSATNYLLVRAVINMSHGAAGGPLCALFRDAGANALAFSGQYHDAGSGQVQTLVIEYYVVAGSTDATTFRIRGSATTSGTYTFCPTATYGACTLSSITITEIKAS